MSNASSSLNTLASAAKASAIALYARPSASYAAKHAQAEALLRRAAALGDVTQANSLGVEDMVITDLIRRGRLGIPVFVLETGALHTETLALLERLQAQLDLSAAPELVAQLPNGSSLLKPMLSRGYIKQGGDGKLSSQLKLKAGKASANGVALPL